MNFKQRLFTLLLGLLFATVLTDQASALYDPGVGRFCSRDPIGYDNGHMLYGYCVNRPGIAVDPSGLVFALIPGPFVPQVGSPTDDLLDDLPRLARQRLTCEEALEEEIRKKHEIHPDLDFVNSCFAHFFCSSTGGNAGPRVGQAFPRIRAFICLDGRPGNKAYREEWLALIVHEAMHAAQYIRGHKCLCHDHPYKGKDNPRVPSLNGENLPKNEANCQACLNVEEPIYRVQAGILFPGDDVMQARFVEAGLCASCKHVCKKYDGGCPERPVFEYPFEL